MTDLQIIREKLKWLNDNKYLGYPYWEVRLDADDVTFIGKNYDPNFKQTPWLIRDSMSFQPHIEEKLEYLISRGFTAEDYKKYTEEKRSKEVVESYEYLDKSKKCTSSPLSPHTIQF